MVLTLSGEAFASLCLYTSYYEVIVGILFYVKGIFLALLEVLLGKIIQDALYAQKPGKTPKTQPLHITS